MQFLERVPLPACAPFSDATGQVAMGSGAWEHRSCPQAVAVDDLGLCTYAEPT